MKEEWKKSARQQEWFHIKFLDYYIEKTDEKKMPIKFQLIYQCLDQFDVATFCIAERRTGGAIQINELCIMLEESIKEPGYKQLSDPYQVFEFFKEVDTICKNKEKVGEEITNQQLDQSEEKLEKIGMEVVLKYFVDVLTNVYDPEEIIWKTFRLETMFQNE